MRFKVPSFIISAFKLYLDYGNRLYFWIKNWMIERLKETLAVLVLCFILGGLVLGYGVYISS